MSKNVLVVGSINVDYVIHTPRLPKLGETISGEGFAVNCGGKGANQAVAISKSGNTVKMLGAVGKDSSGELAIGNLEKFGVDCSAVVKVDAPTGAAVITVCKGDNYIILDVGANAYVTPELINNNIELFDWADIVVMQFEIPTSTVLEVAKLAKGKGKIVIVNPAPVKNIDAEVYSYVDFIIPNEFEAGLITGITINTHEDAQNVVRALCELGCKNAIVTLGKHGCVYGNNENIGASGIYDIDAIDTTAAGDSFIGGLCSKLCEKADVGDAISYASAVSAITVSRNGAAASIPYDFEVEAFISNNKIGKYEFS